MVRKTFKIPESFAGFFSKFIVLLTHKTFWRLTVVGNSIILLFSIIIYEVEMGTNPKMHHYIDAVWWSFVTATTVGYGDITPVTVPGRIIGIALMLTGTCLFATFTAFFAQFFLGKEEEAIHHRLDEIMKKLDSTSCSDFNKIND